MVGVQWYLVVALFPKIDAQKNPLPAMLAAGIVCVLLWILVGAARRHETRSTRRGNRSSSWQRGSPRPPRF